MNTFEDNLQVALRDLAEDVGTEPQLRWVAPAKPDRTRARRALAVAAIVLAVVATSVVVLRQDRPTVVEPVRRPPHVVGLSGEDAPAPGQAVLSFTLGDLSGSDHLASYVVALGARDAVGLPLEDELPSANFARPQLSATGRHYLAQDERFSASWNSELYPTIVLVDLLTGRRNDLGGARGFCPELSPDDRWVAFLSDTGVRRVDVRTGRISAVQMSEARPDAAAGCAGGIGWSPVDDLIAFGRPTFQAGRPDSTQVVDLDGRTVAELGGHLVNGSMSWSPDGATLLLYTPQTGEYTLARLDGTAVPVPAPPDTVSALGWAGSRIVWLTGSVGEQRLVTTDRDGRQLRPWTRLAVGDRPVTSVTWSWDLAGTAAR